jgi:hypothetical protein
VTFPTIPTVAAGRVLTTNQADTSGTRTFPSLTGLTKNSGDLLIAIIVGYQGAQADADFGSWGGGFTEFTDQSSTTNMAWGAAYKWSTGSETGTFTVTQSATVVGHASMILLSIPGAHASTPPEAGQRAVGTTSAANPVSFNPSGWDAEDTLWISLVGSGLTGAGGSWTATGTTAPTSYTDRVDTNTTDSSTVGQTEAAVAFRQLNAASEDVDTAGVDTSSARNAALVIAVRPAAGATEIDPPPATAAGTAGVATVTAAANIAIAAVAAVAIGLVVPAAVDASIQNYPPPAPAVGVATEQITTVDVTVGPSEAVGIGIALPADVSTGVPPVEVDPPPGTGIGVSSPATVTATAEISVTATPAPAVGTVAPPTVAATAEIGVITPPAAALGVVAPSEISLAALTQVNPPAGTAAGVSSPSTVTATAQITVDPPPGTAVGVAAPSTVTIPVFVTVDTTPAVALGVVSPSTITLTALTQITSTPAVGVGVGLPATVTTVDNEQPPSAVAVGIALPATLTITSVDLITSVPALAVGVGIPPVVLTVLPDFWNPDPVGYTSAGAGYTANPSAYDPIEGPDYPPWP